MNISLQFDKGTILVHGAEKHQLQFLKGLSWDERTNCFRAPAAEYRKLVTGLRKHKIIYNDNARKFSAVTFPLKKKITPRSFQTEAAEAWIYEKRGVVALPTGAGKTILAVMLIARTGRPTLIHVPTIDLMGQWNVVLN